MFDVSILLPGLNAPPPDTVVHHLPRRSMEPFSGYMEPALEMTTMMSESDTGETSDIGNEYIQLDSLDAQLGPSLTRTVMVWVMPTISTHGVGGTRCGTPGPACQHASSHTVSPRPPYLRTPT